MEKNGQAHKQQHNTQQMVLNPRLNEQNKSENVQSQQLQQGFQTNQQVPLHILQMQKLQHNAQQNQLSSYEPSSQIQRNAVQNQQSIQQSPHSLQQNHHSAQVFSLLQDQQAVMRSVHIMQSCSTTQQVLARSKPKPTTVGALQQELHHQQNRLDSNNSVAVHENEGPISEKCDSSTSSSSSQDLQDGFNRDIRELEDLLSKLNPMAKEFVPPSFANHASAISLANAFLQNNNNTNININGDSGIINLVNNNNTRRKTNYQGKRRMNSRTSIAQRDDSIRRTVYVSDIDQQVTEEQLAALFINCGQVVDCRVCGDPNSVLRFAFVEFVDEEGARAALSLAGTMLGYYPVRVLPSKTAIAPVNPTFLPRSEDEREMCARTIYCTNIDKKVSQADVKLFFQLLCGEVSRLRLLGDYHHSTRIAFVEFVMAESAIAALNCSGAILGSLPIRVSPSKTPVRPRTSRALMH